MLGEHEKRLKITSRRRVIYKLFEEPKTRKQKMAYRQTSTKLNTYFKTDVNNKNIFRNSYSTLSWKALRKRQSKQPRYVLCEVH